jgi:hypothetical protein
VLATRVARGCHLVMRCPRQSFTAVTQFWAARTQERVVTLTVTSKAHASGRAPPLPTTLRVRLGRVLLATGEVEGLGTDLLDAQTYPAAELKGVDSWRWQQETSHERIKNIFAIERFSGPSVQVSKQDF